MAVVLSILADAGRERDEAGRPISTRSAYPPSTFVVLSPLSALSWNSARLAWLATLIALFALHVVALLRLCDLRPLDTKGLALIGAVLALAPYHTGITLGQLSIASIELTIVAVAFVDRNLRTCAALTLALALSIKPQLAAPFAIHFFIRQQRKVAILAVGISGLILAAAAGWLWWNRLSWITPLRENIAAEFGRTIDPAGPLSVQMIDLRPLLVAVIPTPNAGVIGSAFVFVAATALYWRNRHLADELWLLSWISVLTLLFGYHRFYDAALLCLPLGWAIHHASEHATNRWPAAGVIACTSVFLLPGAVMLDRVSQSREFFWNAIILRHQIWALLALLTFLFVARPARQAVVSTADCSKAQ